MWCVDKSQLILTVHFLPLLNFATASVKLIPHETASTISGGYESSLSSSCRTVLYCVVHCLFHACYILRMYNVSQKMTSFWVTVCKTVTPYIIGPLSVLCCPNRWMDQDTTWRGGRPRPWPLCVRWRPSSPQKRHSPPHFSAHAYWGQMAGWIKMPLGREVGLGPSDIVLGGDRALPKGHSPPPPIFGPCLL